MHGAGEASLRSTPDVMLLVNHQALPLARTISGTLRLVEDNIGLRNIATLDPEDPDAMSIAVKMHRGDVTGQSFAFSVQAQDWNRDCTERWITGYDIH
jgi:uncharacterized protein